MGPATGPFVLRARAKLNLTLGVGQVQANGLHEIRSVMADLQLADELEFAPTPGPFSITNESLEAPQRADLVWRAAMALRPELSGWRIRVRKQIPVQAGLGGGSTDAAAALRGVAAIMEGLGISMTDARLRMIAPQLGSDVAACLLPGLKVVSGTGERVERVATPAPPWGVLLLQPRARVPTGDAYRLLDRARASDAGELPPDRSTEMCDAYAAQDFEKTRALLHNDFQPVVEAAFDEIREAQRRMLAAGAAEALLCGSGSCVAALFESHESAQAARARLDVQPFEWAAVTAFSDGA